MTRLLPFAILGLLLVLALAPRSASDPVYPAGTPAGLSPSGAPSPFKPTGAVPASPDPVSEVGSDAPYPAGSPDSAWLGALPPYTQHSDPTARPTPRPTVRPTIREVPAYRTPPLVRAGAQTLTGVASYYGTGGPGSYAAMGGYQAGERVVVVVTAFHDGRVYSVTLPVVTSCAACRWAPGATLIDLSIPAWKALADQIPLSRGVLKVQVSVVEGRVR